MASFRKHKSGWQAQVARKGVRRSKILPTKREAQDWAAQQEHAILNALGEYGPGTIGDLLDRYAREVSPKKAGERWELLRLNKMSQDKLAEVSVSDVRPGDFADWRDRRLLEVSDATVRREMILLSAVMSRAVKEWGVLPFNPVKDVERPKSPPPRDRRVTVAEVEALVDVVGTDLSRPRARAVHAFRFAIETAMRAGEICSLTNDSVSGRVARLEKTKNGQPRDVPLSSAALALWGELPGDGFEMTPHQLDGWFRAARDKTDIKGLTFHDSRHEAITRMSDRVDILALARIVGHKDLKMLQVYYSATAEQLAAKLG